MPFSKKGRDCKAVSFVIENDFISLSIRHTLPSVYDVIETLLLMRHCSVVAFKSERSNARCNVAVAFRTDFCVPHRGNTDDYNWREST